VLQQKASTLRVLFVINMWRVALHLQHVARGPPPSTCGPTVVVMCNIRATLEVTIAHLCQCAVVIIMHQGALTAAFSLLDLAHILCALRVLRRVHHSCVVHLCVG
jgi:hypothetical protein